MTQCEKKIVMYVKFCVYIIPRRLTLMSDPHKVYVLWSNYISDEQCIFCGMCGVYYIIIYIGQCIYQCKCIYTLALTVLPALTSAPRWTSGGRTWTRGTGTRSPLCSPWRAWGRPWAPIRGRGLTQLSSKNNPSHVTWKCFYALNSKHHYLSPSKMPKDAGSSNLDICRLDCRVKWTTKKIEIIFNIMWLSFDWT